eukprot:CFRG2887T1
MTDSLATLIGHLQATISPNKNVRKDAEKSLDQASTVSNFSILLLQVISEDTNPKDVRVAAAVTFKNFVKTKWEIDGTVNHITDADRKTIKHHIVDLMLNMPSQLQAQLSEGVSLIGKHDFPDEWPELLPALVAKLDNNDVNVINGVLRTAASLFNHYTYEFKSDKLWSEILVALTEFAQPLTDITLKMISILPSHASDQTTLTTVFTLLQSSLEIFYSLNYQDLPEFFEDNMDTWMGIFHTLLTYDNALVRSDSEDRPGPLEQTKFQVCENISLYAVKYDEENVPFRKHLPMFVEDIWNLLSTTSAEAKNDYLVSGSLSVLSAVAKRPVTAQLFAQEGILKVICEKIIIPNMQLRESDVESYEDDPEEYIRRDIEGSDTETRRRAACDLVKALRRHFEKEVTAIFSSYVGVMLEQYAKDPANNWKAKDAAIFLVTSLTVTSSVSSVGATKINEFINILDFFSTAILPELQQPDVNSHPVLRSDGIKYITTFRNQLSKPVLLQCLPLVISHVMSNSVVLHSYAANCIERILMIKDSSDPAANKKSLVTREDVQPMLQAAITNLFAAMAMDNSGLNTYIMKTIMRLINVGKQDVQPLLALIMERLVKKLEEVCANPTKPDFNHYLFESISASIRYMCGANRNAVGAFEDALFPIFSKIFTSDVNEFMTYVFQLMSQMLELRTSPIPETYTAFFPHLMAVQQWEKSGNIPGLAKLMQTYISKTGASMTSTPEIIQSLLGIFQKLVASKANDHHGFGLLNAIIEFVPLKGFSAYLKDIYKIIFSRLQAAKTPKLVRSVIVTTSLIIGLHGPDVAVNAIDQIQPNLFGMVISSLYLPGTQKLQTSRDRKTCAVGIIRLLTESEAMITTYDASYASLLTALLKLFEMPKEREDEDDVGEVNFNTSSEYQTVHTHLSFASKAAADPFPTVVNVRMELASGLQKMSIKIPGKVPQLVQSMDPHVQSILSGYLQQAGVTLA